jgi:hypothetical protein
MPSPIQSKNTYYACTDALLVTVVTKDKPWFALGGVAGKHIKLQYIRLHNLTLTAIELTRLQLQKTVTAATSGAGTDLVKVPAVTGQAASTALCRGYTAAPTRGTLVGAVAVRRIPVPTATPVATDGVRGSIEFDFRNAGECECPGLDGTTENLVLCFIEADAGSAVSMELEVCWTEEG